MAERTLGWPSRLTSIAFGGDYNPEQWDEDVWAEDVRLMHEAGVNLLTVNVFGWAEIEPAPGRYDFDRLDRVMELLAGAGIHVDLATGTASPPPWFSHRYPDTLPVTREGIRLSSGGRQAWCPSSPVFRRAALALVEAVATRYADHDALVMWHVSNELGCHNAHCYCDVSAVAFRHWLLRRYGGLDALNEAWATSFWSQRYTDWEEVLPPRVVTAIANPTQQLDFRRFSGALRRGRWPCPPDLLQRHRRRARPRPPRRLPGSVPRHARGPGRGVLPAAPGRVRPARRRDHRGRLDRAAADVLVSDIGLPRSATDRTDRTRSGPREAHLYPPRRRPRDRLLRPLRRRRAPAGRHP